MDGAAEESYSAAILDFTDNNVTQYFNGASILMVGFFPANYVEEDYSDYCY